MTMFDLKGRVAVVTGGNGGIGLGMAKGLAGAGADVVVAARNAEKNAAAVAALSALGVRASAIAVDVCKEDSVKAMIAEAERSMGRVDILVNNAGINIRKRPEEYVLGEWLQVIETNLTSAFLCCHAAYPAMKRAGGGKIVNIGSMMSIFGAAFTSAYAASKGGIVQFTKALATAWAQDNIQVNAVLPGWIDTDLTRAARSQVQGLHDRVVTRTPAGRWGTPEDHAGIAVFLASRASDFVTGTAIPVDGGYSVQGV
ncbi:MAG: glucose 1-dehydrogenase [Alphaproteobacteria bacterium]